MGASRCLQHTKKRLMTHNEEERAEVGGEGASRARKTCRYDQRNCMAHWASTERQHALCHVPVRQKVCLMIEWIAELMIPYDGMSEHSFSFQQMRCFHVLVWSYIIRLLLVH